MRDNVVSRHAQGWDRICGTTDRRRHTFGDRPASDDHDGQDEVGVELGQLHGCSGREWPSGRVASRGTQPVGMQMSWRSGRLTGALPTSWAQGPGAGGATATATVVTRTRTRTRTRATG